MCNRKFILLLLLGAVVCTTAFAQDSTEVNVQQKGRYAFVVYAGGGWFSYLGAIGSPALRSTTDIIRAHPTGTLRIMWHPDHRLRVGLETGYNSLYTYTTRNGDNSGKVNLTSIPVLLVWSMALSTRLNVYAGAGAYLLTTHLDYKGNVSSKTLSLGVNAAVNYVIPVSRKFGLGAEMKWTDAAQTRDFGFSGQLLLVWKLVEW